MNADSALRRYVYLHERLSAPKPARAPSGAVRWAAACWSCGGKHHRQKPKDGIDYPRGPDDWEERCDKDRCNAAWDQVEIREPVRRRSPHPANGKVYHYDHATWTRDPKQTRGANTQDEDLRGELAFLAPLFTRPHGWRLRSWQLAVSLWALYAVEQHSVERIAEDRGLEIAGDRSARTVWRIIRDARETVEERIEAREDQALAFEHRAAVRALFAAT
jgi:hypothetical protein